MSLPIFLRRYSLFLSASAAAFFTFPRNHCDPDSNCNDMKTTVFKKKSSWNHEWDLTQATHRQSSLQNRRLKLIILVRHGQYNKKAASPQDRVLTELGWEQAIATGRRLCELGYDIDCIVHSDMIRAQQTTAAIISQLDNVYLSETGILDVKNKPSSLPDSGILFRPSPLVSKSCPLLESALMAEGPPPVEPEPSPISRVKYLESLGPKELSDRIEMQNRVSSSFHYHIHRRPISVNGERALRADPADRQFFEVVLFVGHANVFRYWLCRALQLPPEAWLRISLPHGSITELLVEVTPSKCTVTALRVGDDGHMPVEIQSR